MNAINALNNLEHITKEIAIISTIAFAGFVFIIKYFKNRKKENEKVLSKNILMILIRTKLFFNYLNHEIHIETNSIKVNPVEENKLNKVHKMNQYVDDLYIKCEKNLENGEKETEDKKINSKNEKIFCYLLKNVSKMITHKNNNG